MRLELTDIHKSFGTKHVLRGLSLHVENGRATGLLGRNGSGKTTTARIILNVFLPDKGTVTLDGRTIRAEDADIGYLPEEKGLYPKLPVLDQLIYFGRLRGLPRRQALEAAEHWLGVVELSHEKSRRLETLSKGNQQKVQLICALLTNPQILILDEPFGGLDPVNARLLKTIVNEQVADGKLVLFSSHQMADVESFCDDIAILHDGVIARSGRLSDIKRSYPQNRVELRLVRDGRLQSQREVMEALKPKSQAFDSITPYGQDTVAVRFRSETDRLPFLRTLIDSGFDVDLYRILVPSLDEIFVETTAGGQSHE